MKCKYCGNTIRDDMNYCTNCGKQLRFKNEGSKLGNFFRNVEEVGGISTVETYSDNEGIFEDVNSTIRESDTEAWVYEIERAYDKYKDVKLRRWLGILICVVCAVIPLNATFCLSMVCFMLYDFGVTASKMRKYYGFMLMRTLIVFEVMWIVALIFDIVLGMEGIF